MKAASQAKKRKWTEREEEGEEIQPMKRCQSSDGEEKRRKSHWKRR